MESKHSHLETNTVRFIQDSYNQQARLNAGLQKNMLHRLQEASGMYRRRIEFPDGALLSLSGVLALTTLWLVIQVISGQTISSSASLTITAVILILNLLLVPVASVVIVIRRRHVKAP